MNEGDGAQEPASRGEHEASPRLSASEVAEMRKEIEARLDALFAPAAAGSSPSPPADAAEGSWAPTVGDEEHDAGVATPGDDGEVAPPVPPATDTSRPSAPEPPAPPTSRASARDAEDAEERLLQARQRMAERQAEAERAAAEGGAARRRQAGGWVRTLLWGAVVLAVVLVVLRLAGG